MLSQSLVQLKGFYHLRKPDPRAHFRGRDYESRRHQVGLFITIPAFRPQRTPDRGATCQQWSQGHQLGQFTTFPVFSQRQNLRAIQLFTFGELKGQGEINKLDSFTPAQHFINNVSRSLSPEPWVGSKPLVCLTGHSVQRFFTSAPEA